MIFKDIQNWSNPNELPGLLFFAQRMDELSFEYSLDSFKAPTLNAPFLIIEMLSEIQINKQIGRSHSAIAHILDEAESRLKNDIVAPNLLSPGLPYYLNADRQKPEDIEARLRVLGTELHPNRYLRECYRLIDHAIQENRKISIDFLSKEIVTTLQSLGVSSFEINSKVNETFFGSKKISSTSILSTFFKNFNPPKVREFEVAIKVDSQIRILKKDILDIFNFSLEKEIPEHLKHGCSKELLNITKNERILLASKVKAYDPFSALSLLRMNIDRLQDLYGLFNHKSSYKISNTAQIFDVESHQVHSQRTSINRMHFVRDNKPAPAAKKLGKMIQNLHLPRGADADKFFRAIDFHGLGSKSESVENQIINLWTSLETIVPFEGTGPIGTNVVNKILPLIGLQYFDRIFAQVAFDLERWDSEQLSETFEKIGIAGQHSNTEGILRLVALKENDSHLKELYTKLGNFELLRFRLFEFNKTFLDPRKIYQKLLEHQRRVEWQLHRIYRTRNSIVHSGQTQAFGNLLISNAHDYFDQVFALVSALCSGRGGFDNFSDSFNFAAWSYSDYEKSLKNLENVSEETVVKLIWKRKTVQ